MQSNSILLAQNAIKCPRLNQGKLICINPLCNDPSQNPAICTQECESCQKSHKICKLYPVKSILQQVSQKRQKITPQVQQAMKTMENVYDEGIQRIVKDKQQALAQMEFFGLNAFQAEFMKIITQGRSNELTGKNIVSKVHQNLKIKQEFFATQQIVNKAWNKKRQKFDYLLSKLKKLQIHKSILLDSKITEQTQVLQSFFDKEIFQIKLLFRASEHNFDTNMFHAKCDGKQHTITLIQTQFGKIIGGYTPLAWLRTNAYIADYKMQSFLFSITEGQKYQIVNPNEAIYGGNAYGPTFGGGHDIYITTGRNVRANPNEYDEQENYDEEGSYFNFPYTYAPKNSTLTNGSVEAIQKFTGRTDGNTYANVKQYQVFHVQFI